MIRIHKPDQPPQILTTKGKAKRRGASSAYSRSANAYKNGSRKFSFYSEIYAHRSVKKALIVAQYEKCAFCESKITHISYGDVEHFRPKAGCRQNTTDGLTTPGYYWLAYEWDNLLLSCQLCNQRYKKNLFPLADPAKRAISHREDLNQEEPLFINPAVDDPEQHISFRKEIPFAIDENLKGRTTITHLGIDRPELNEIRLDRYEMLESLYNIAYVLPPSPETDRAKAILNKAVQPSAQFASMVRAALAVNFASGL